VDKEAPIIKHPVKRQMNQCLIYRGKDANNSMEINTKEVFDITIHQINEGSENSNIFSSFATLDPK
jgi:hypothetical protein